MENRTNKFEQPELPKGSPVKTIHAVQTPFGTFQVVIALVPGQPDPLAFCLSAFQEAIKAGAEDPLHATLLRLREMARGGISQPLEAGLELLKQMCAANVLEPLDVLLANAGFGADEIAQLTGGQKGVLDSVIRRADKPDLN
ncbi:MAG: hypothetical protein IT461_14575 [Planctomycetes bacterium]|jgi:hypothetical protein|nr:hypothetical protein [Planctomycetota bacterium]